MRRKLHARAKPYLCPPLKLGRELARELEKPPLGYISTTRVPPHLTSLSPSLLTHQSPRPTPLFVAVHRGRLDLGMIPAKPRLPSSFQDVHRVPLIPLSSPTPSPLAGAPCFAKHLHRLSFV